MKIITYIFVLSLSMLLSSCSFIEAPRSFVTEVSKTLWGSSTRALENARVSAVSQSFRCSLDECFDAVLTLAGKEKQVKVKIEEEEESAEGKEKIIFKKRFEVFIKNRIKQHIIVMGVEGNVETTEVGIFFDKINENIIKIDISSLSLSAKRKVSKAIFEELSLQFTP